ncbi:MAG: hypothetical protein V4739_04080, partial [Pseudomonadota bacterium]
GHKKEGQGAAPVYNLRLLATAGEWGKATCLRASSVSTATKTKPVAQEAKGLFALLGCRL